MNFNSLRKINVHFCGTYPHPQKNESKMGKMKETILFKDITDKQKKGSFLF